MAIRWRWKRTNGTNAAGSFSLSETLEVAAPPALVFEYWVRYEEFPAFMESVRRTKCIDERRVLWDIDVMGRQIVWEARITRIVPNRVVRWESTWGASHAGEVRFEALAEGRTRLTAEIDYRPRGLLQQLGARVALLDLHVRRDLERFRSFVEQRARDERPDLVLRAS